VLSGSNRTIVGLKLVCQVAENCGSGCSNRTIVGLKPGNFLSPPILERQQQSHHCGIETAALHQIFNFDFKQQSHHCGIETRKTSIDELRESSNRTIVGLKPLAEDIVEFARRRSNRTIVGLKQKGEWILICEFIRSNRTIVGLKHCVECKDWETAGAQQSHHCGIETSAGEKVKVAPSPAAIAPLWD